MSVATDRLDAIDVRARATRSGYSVQTMERDVPDLIAALCAVLDLHRRSMFPKHGGPLHGQHVCVECSSQGWQDDDPPGTAHPCPTVRAVESALGCAA